VKFWGVRGSIPAPLSTEQLQDKLFRALTASKGLRTGDPAEVRAFIASLPPAVSSVVGGNTTCVEISSGDDTIIIDAGSGIRQLGYALMASEFGRGQGVAHIFLTHAHWDHLQGLPFFAPAFVPGNRLIFYAVNHDPRDFLEHQQVAPVYFPIPIAQMAADMSFVTLNDGEMVQIGRCAITNLALYHPGTAYAYRFDDGESVFVFASDGEYQSLDDDGLRRFVEFFYNADALVFDCQYSLRDVLLSKADWGHSSAMIGVEIAERAQAKRLITTHYDPSDTDDQIYSVVESARRYAEITPTPGAIEVIVGAEGLELFLGAPIGLEVLEDREAEVWLMALAGKLDSETAQAAHPRLSEFLKIAPGHKALLDLTLLSSIDPIGVRAIIAAARDVPGSQLAFVAPATFVRRSLENSGAREVGPIFRNRAHAIAAISGPVHLHLHEQMLADYRLGEPIAADDFGAIYAAMRPEGSTSLVIQVIGLDSTPQQRLAFAQSAQSWCRLTHPRLIPGVEVVQQGGLVAFVGERPSGQRWMVWVEGYAGRVSVEAGLRWLREMAEALYHAHRQGVTHGELCPECFVFTNDHARISRVPFSPHLASPAAYRSPEQLRGRPPVPQSDQFTLGVLLYEALIGINPFATESEDLTLAQQLQGAPLSPRAFRTDVSEALEDFILRLLAREPAERFASTEDILDAVDQLLSQIVSKA
jgi:phosphoribosyl 1,2-cyclic phosphodiesterase/anti-anti-sigma regulatory factor